MKKVLSGLFLLITAFILVACVDATLPTYTVTFNSNGGSAVAAQTVTEGSLAVQPSSPTRDGFLFDRWYSDAGLATEFNFTTPITANVTLYAGYVELPAGTYVVSFDSNGGSFVAPQAVEDGSTATAPTAPTRTGYTFVAWYTQGEDGEGNPALIVYSFATPVTANITLVAGWEALPPTVDTNATYYDYIGSTINLNPYAETLANASTLFGYLATPLYRGDYDWARAIEDGLAAHVGDFTNTENLPFTYVPYGAAALPVDVNGDGTVWKITLREDLKFEDGTAIDAETFNYSWKQLLDPKLLNARATNLYSADSLPLVNAQTYFTQLVPDVDSLNFHKYTVGEGEAAVVYARANSEQGVDDYGDKIFTPEPSEYDDLVGPEGASAYVANWSAYGTYAGSKSGWVLQNTAGAAFRIFEGELLAPTAGWTLDGEDLEVYVGATHTNATYVGLYPAYADEDQNLAEVDEDGFPVDGYLTYEDAVEVPWEDVGFEVLSQYEFQITLTQKKSQWQVMTNLTSAITGVVHPGAYEAGKIEDGTRTTYGSIDNPLVSYGPYNLVEWVNEGFFLYEKNADHFDADAFRISKIRFDVINDQSIAINEFSQGRLDVVGVSGAFFPQYQNHAGLKLVPATTFFRFAFGIDYGKDGDDSNDNPILQYVEFRQALYFAVDRETFVTDVRAPGYATHGVLGPIYFSSEQNPFSYRASEAGQAVLADLAPDTAGYNPVLAKELFDEAYAKAVADGAINDGDVVSIRFVFADAETNHTMANWLESTVEAIFGNKFDLVKEPVPSAALSAAGGIWDQGLFDITFGGWQGLQFWAPQMLQVYSDVLGAAYILEVGFETGDAELSVDLAAGKAAVEGWLADLEEIAEPTEIQEDYIGYFEDFLDAFEGTVWTGTYDELWSQVYSVVLDFDLYDGRDEDFDYITATLEAELLRQVINIPLFTSVTAVVYSSRVVFEANAYHARMGWGGARYMYLAQQ